MLVSYITLALSASSNALSALLYGRFDTLCLVLSHAIALVHHYLRHDVSGALTPGAQELSMQRRQLLD